MTHSLRVLNTLLKSPPMVFLHFEVTAEEGTALGESREADTQISHNNNILIQKQPAIRMLLLGCACAF